MNSTLAIIIAAWAAGLLIGMIIAGSVLLEQAAQSDRAVCQSSQAVPPHRNPLRENRQSVSFDAMYRGSKTLD
jgi:hypothetical protein